MLFRSVIGVALDTTNGELTFYKNGTSQGVAYTLSTSNSYVIALAGASTVPVLAVNFGQRPFSYTPPSGYVALNTYNLSTPTIPAGNKYMDATIYTGTATTQTITNAGGFKPDLIWTKSRTSTDFHTIMDSVRGTGKSLFANDTQGE